MKYGFLFLFHLIIAFSVKAQKNDALEMSKINGKFMAIHVINPDENLYSIAQLYGVPAILLSQSNDIPFYEKLQSGKNIFIPIGNFNYAKSQGSINQKKLIYSFNEKESYSNLSILLGVSESDLMTLNQNMLIEELKGKIMMGWIQYNASEPKSDEKPKVKVDTIPPPKVTVIKKSIIEDTAIGAPSDFETAYKFQTSNGQYIDSLEGTVVFFKPQSVVNEKMLYAFSNDIAKGRILKVVNPSNKRYVYAKVIGRIPNTKQYLNAKIGLDGRARDMLLTREIKLWCNFYLKY